MTVDRRTVLRGGLALGLGATVWGRGGQPIARAGGVGQRLALLMGVDTVGGGLQALKGCQADVEALTEVLQGRYGFLATDVVALTRQQGTLTAISETFDQHLRQRAQKNDAVVVYFSGYGVYAPPANLTPVSNWEQALPYLGLLPTDALTNGDRPQILALGTVINWLQSLKTKQVTLILDCGFSPTHTPFYGNLRSRSAGSLIPDGEVSTSKISLGSIQLISAVAPGQTAVEGPLAATTMGLFTYGFIQSLWQADSVHLMGGLWEHSRLVLVPRRGPQQTPQWLSSSNSTDFLPPLPAVTAGEGGIITHPVTTSLASRLSGLAPLVYRQALVHSCYLPTAIANPIPLAPSPLWQVDRLKGTQASLIPLPSRDPAPTVASPIESPVAGNLREIYRAIPTTLTLTIALGTDLERIERVDATSAFGAIASVAAVVNAGDSAADCVFGKLDTHRYTLFSEGGELLQPLTKSESSGAIKTVVSALEPALNRLLALKWLTLLANGDSTRLGMHVVLTQQTSGDNPLPRTLYDWRSPRFPFPKPPTTSDPANGVPSAPPDFLPTVAPNQTLQWQLDNLSQETLYGCLLGIDNRNQGMAGIFEPQLQLLKPRQRLTLPHADAPPWTVSGEKGIAQWFLILSRYPLPATLAALGQQVTSNASNPNAPTAILPTRLLPLKDLLAVVQALVTDLSLHPPAAIPPPDDANLWDVADWLCLPILYQVL